MAILVILLMLIAFILFAGMMGDKEQANRNNYTQAFCVVVAAVVLLVIFG